MTRTRLFGGVLVLGGVAFGFAGGEYGTLDWWKLRRDVRTERNAVQRLEAEIDSLASVAEALERDPATQERVAREQFGMALPGEMLFRVEAGPQP